MIVKKKRIKTPPLFPWQQSIIKGVLKYPHDIHVVKSRRQCGKSVTVEVLLLYYAINKMGSTSICISPTLNQSRKIYKEIVRSIKDLPIYKSSNATTLEINFDNNSTILLKSGEQQAGLRGNTVSGCLIFDEAVFIPDEVIFECMPFVDANRAPILMTSTPKFKDGIFYNFFEKGKQGEKGYHIYDINDWDTSALLSPERLEMYRKSMAPLIFASEYLGNFIEAVSSVFGDVERLCGTTIHSSNTKVLGVDWSNGALDKGGNPDDTALVVMNDHNEMEFVDSFSDREPTETIDYIIQIIQRYGVKKAVCESNSMGATYINLLKREISRRGIRCQVVEFVTTNESKRDIIERLQVECRNGTIQLIKDNKLLLEMVSYQAEKTPTGKITYNASAGCHDDIVIALALALHGLRTGQYNIR